MNQPALRGLRTAEPRDLGRNARSGESVSLGVFAIGQFWWICSSAGVSRGHQSRAVALRDAVNEARRIASEGGEVELLVQGEAGRIERVAWTSVDLPPETS